MFKNGLPSRPREVRRLMRTFLTRPPRAAKTPLTPVGASQGDRRPRTLLENIFNILLFHRDTFGQIPWLIHICTPQHGDMIRQQLQRNRKQNRREQRMGVGNREHRIGDLS